jgi:mannose-6-phosphate isomerase
MHDFSPHPLLLDPASFTPRVRTPWGGPRLPALKARVVRGELDPVIGESWELSVVPDFPSRLEDGRLLADVIAETRAPLLGAERASMELLVKLLDASASLSVQIHPRDDDPALGPDEGGKPEAWYVVDHTEGAGVYLGLADGVDQAAMRAAIHEGRDVSRLLRFHPVARGDFFVVEPGVPHAVGAGVFLVEPQRVRAGRRGITYRYWDWNRRYDAEGHESSAGEPRALHVERALAVTDFTRARGDAFDRASKRTLGPPPRDGFHLEPLAGCPGGLASNDLFVMRVAGTGRGTLPTMDRLMGLTVVRGTIEWADGSCRVEAGRTAVLPAALEHREVIAQEAEAILAAIF